VFTVTLGKIDESPYSSQWLDSVFLKIATEERLRQAIAELRTVVDELTGRPAGPAERLGRSDQTALPRSVRVGVMQSILQRYENVPLGEIFSDDSPVSIWDESVSWLNLPAQGFLDYARRLKPAPYAGVPENPKVFRAGATFLLAQAHRIWLTLGKVDQYLSLDPGAVLLDLGAYPFAVDTAIRLFLKRDCRIIGTINQVLTSEALSQLEELRIELVPVNLDPFVRAEAHQPGMVDYLPLEDSSVDLVLFAHVIEHLYHPLSVLREAARVLKPGGKLILSTDNAFLLGGLLNHLAGGQYLHEPVEGTAAMVFHDWRGHVRLFSEGDLSVMTRAVGLPTADCAFYEVLYNSLPSEYFVEPVLNMARWRAKVLGEFPQLRNEILMVCGKP
jgi:SAM-dependent methyltransferase